MKKHAILFANGQVTGQEIGIARKTKFDIVVAADGGAVNGECFGFEPDVVVGDFDSLPENFQKRHPRIRFIHRPSQERCDLEKALIFCEEEGISDITLLGATGKRLDHTLGNLSLIARYNRRFQLRILTPEAELFIVRNRLKLEGIPGQAVSLVPAGEAKCINTSGLKYPLNGENLIFGQREGTSNEFSRSHCEISITGGLLFVFRLYTTEN